MILIFMLKLSKERAGIYHWRGVEVVMVVMVVMVAMVVIVVMVVTMIMNTMTKRKGKTRAGKTRT